MATVLGLASTCLAQSTAEPPHDDSMVLIHGGTFQMGIDPADIPHFQKLFAIENPHLFRDLIAKHEVTLDDFYIDKHLVTNAQFKNFVEANPMWQQGRLPAEFDNGNYLRHWMTPAAPNAKPDHPVVNVNWYAATVYCHWAGKRLPTEAEWGFAARGGLSSPFPWGDAAPDETRANSGDRIGTTSAVGSYPANPYGLFDMAGNVWQFLADEWARYPSSAGQAAGRNSILNRDEPEKFTFPLNSPRRVIRGGSFAGAPVNLWLEYRDSHPANGSRDYVGFRCARSVSAKRPSP
jgi:sulfatase modifying factor 1